MTLAMRMLFIIQKYEYKYKLDPESRFLELIKPHSHLSDLLLELCLRIGKLHIDVLQFYQMSLHERVNRGTKQSM